MPTRRDETPLTFDDDTTVSRNLRLRAGLSATSQQTMVAVKPAVKRLSSDSDPDRKAALAEVFSEAISLGEAAALERAQEELEAARTKIRELEALVGRLHDVEQIAELRTAEATRARQEREQQRIDVARITRERDEALSLLQEERKERERLHRLITGGVK